MKRWDVLGFGAVAVDDLVYLDRFPQPDEKMEVLGKTRDGGGLAGTALVAAARLGASAAWAGVLGFDELSLWTLEAFQRAQVDTSPVVRYGEARPIHSIILVDQRGGTRTILYSFEGVEQLTPDEVTPDMIEAARVVFLDHTIGELAGHVLALARNAGVPTIADLERLPAGAERTLVEVDYLIVGRAFAAEVTGATDPNAAAQALAAQRAGKGLTLVTDGERGCRAVFGRDALPEVRHFPALRVDAVDTTGCGDVFHGAFAAELAVGSDLDRAIRVATIAAGLTATQPGGRQGIPTRQDIEARLS